MASNGEGSFIGPLTDVLQELGVGIPALNTLINIVQLAILVALLRWVREH